MSRPPLDLSSEKQKAFDDLWRSTPGDGIVDYRLPYPKWQFLTYLCETKELVLHGSQNLEIDIVEPRQAKDVRDFSKQKAIYATTDGIWVIYFAILDRRNNPEMSLFNSCLQARITFDQLSDPLYFFSITNSALKKEPWCDGMIYILPRLSFKQEAPQISQGVEVVFPHWISSVANVPLARLKVNKADFPFFAQVHGHDNEKLGKLFRDNPGGFNWLDAMER